jgi:hypothetical protein
MNDTARNCAEKRAAEAANELDRMIDVIERLAVRANRLREPFGSRQKNGGSGMNTNESRDRRGRLALEAAITAFDQKLYGTAHTWAEVAAETIKACNLTPAEQRLLVAPRVELSRGDKAAGIFCGLVVIIVLFAALFDPAKDLIVGWMQ